MLKNLGSLSEVSSRLEELCISLQACLAEDDTFFEYTPHYPRSSGRRLRTLLATIVILHAAFQVRDLIFELLNFPCQSGDCYIVRNRLLACPQSFLWATINQVTFNLNILKLTK